jgi:hypothetical protein
VYCIIYCVSHKCVSCRQPSAPLQWLHTASHTFCSLQLMSVITAVRVFCSPPTVRRQTRYKATSDDSTRKKYRCLRSGNFCSHPIGPLHQFIAREELHSTSLAHRQRNLIALRPAKSRPTRRTDAISSKFSSDSLSTRYLSTSTVVRTQCFCVPSTTRLCLCLC